MVGVLFTRHNPSKTFFEFRVRQLRECRPDLHGSLGCVFSRKLDSVFERLKKVFPHRLRIEPSEAIINCLLSVLFNNLLPSHSPLGKSHPFSKAASSECIPPLPV